MTDCLTAFVTVPDSQTADRVADAVLQRRLVACVNVVNGVQSRYWWKGELQSEAEILMIFKLPATMWELFCKTVQENHPYEVPEIISLPIQEGSLPYLKWIVDATKQAE